MAMIGLATNNPSATPGISLCVFSPQIQFVFFALHVIQSPSLSLLSPSLSTVAVYWSRREH